MRKIATLSGVLLFLSAGMLFSQETNSIPAGNKYSFSFTTHPVMIVLAPIYGGFDVNLSALCALGPGSIGILGEISVIDENMHYKLFGMTNRILYDPLITTHVTGILFYRYVPDPGPHGVLTGWYYAVNLGLDYQYTASGIQPPFAIEYQKYNFETGIELGYQWIVYGFTIDLGAGITIVTSFSDRYTQGSLIYPAFRGTLGIGYSL